MPTFKIIIFILTAYLIVSPTVAHSAEKKNKEDSKGIVSLVIENDSFASSDSDYTSGIRLSILSSEEHMPRWITSFANILPLANDGNKRISIAAGQSMFTPQDITNRKPSPNDQPYAGWLYGSIGMVSDTGETLDNVMLTLGVVGPSSLAEQSQISLHNAIGSPHPEGWDHQLKDELGIILTYERKWRAMYQNTPFGMGVDVTPHAGINLGNVNTDASIGATFRFGYDLPSDYGPPRIRPSLPGSDFFLPTKELGGYLFTTISEHAVARNIFLDGNTFSSGPRVDKENWVNSLQVGAAVTYGRTRISYTQVYMSKEYKTQENASQFGVFTVSCRF
ncbi:lipid A deacylase LpxR family protein [Rickettsiales bacterium]|nr:lipid A deacylase LpxR family protein [Rickettsiales bacterium]